MQFKTILCFKGSSDPVHNTGIKIITAKMSKSLRDDKVFIDWSQNTAAKTTLAPYSMRGREQPWVAAPRTWEEMEDPGLSQLLYTEVLDRVEEFGDPLAGRRLTRGVAAGLGPFAARIHGLLGLDPQFSELLRGRLGRHASVPFRTPASSSVSRRARCLPTVPTTGSSTIARWSPSRWTTSRSVTTAAQPPSGSMRS